MARNIVQYYGTNDEPLARNVAGAFGYELVQTNNVVDLYAFTKLIIIGGQVANPIFKHYVDIGKIRNITSGDQGYGFIQYFRWEYFLDGFGEVWAIASYDVPETTASVDYVIKNGLWRYTNPPYIRWKIGSTPPVPPGGGGDGGGGGNPPHSSVPITMSMVFESLKAGVPYYVVGAIVGVASRFVPENEHSETIKKLMLLGALGGVGVGVYATLNDLHNRGGI